jgi:hypothetical protein
MTDSQGFWSYVRADDSADSGRIVQLGKDIVAQYEMLANEKIELFLDVEGGLSWGEDWEKKLQESVARVAFFIPVLTPRYFASASCRSELNTFARTASDLGIRDLLLPVLYVDVPGLHDETPSDDLVALVKRYQWEDWRTLRFANRESGEYRKAVVELASRLVAANRAAEDSPTSTALIDRAEALDDEAGVLDLLATMETSFPDLNETTVEIGLAIKEVGEQTTATFEEFQVGPQQQGFAKRLVLLKSLAARLADPAQRIKRKGHDFARLLHDVDLGVRAIIAKAPSEPESREEFQRFFDQIRKMVTAGEDGLGSLERMLDSARSLESLSRDLKAPFRDMREGATLMIEGREVMRRWIALIDETEL